MKVTSIVPEQTTEVTISSMVIFPNSKAITINVQGTECRDYKRVVDISPILTQMTDTQKITVKKFLRTVAALALDVIETDIEGDPFE